MMRKIAANRILPKASVPLVNGIITIDDRGWIKDLTDTGGNLKEISGLEYYPGTIIPGLVVPNAVLEVPTLENLKKLDRESLGKGIKGMALLLPGQLQNNSQSAGSLFRFMQESRIVYHLVFALRQAEGEEAFDSLCRGKDLSSHAFNEFNLSSSLIPGSSWNVYKDPGNLDLIYQEDPSRPGSSLINANLEPEEQDDLFELIADHESSAEELEKVLYTFTIEVARAIGHEDILGSIEPGKRPGLNLIHKGSLTVLD